MSLQTSIATHASFTSLKTSVATHASFTKAIVHIIDNRTSEIVKFIRLFKACDTRGTKKNSAIPYVRPNKLYTKDRPNLDRQIGEST